MTYHNGTTAFLQKPKTADYRPQIHPIAASWYLTGHRPSFRLTDVDIMHRDPKVKIGLKILCAPVVAVKWEVHSVNQRVEALTDDLAAKPYESLEPAELDELMAALDPLATRLLAAQEF